MGLDGNGAIAAAALMLSVGSVLVAAVWTVATVRSTTAVLAARLEGLKESLDKLDSILHDYRSSNRLLEDRVRQLENEIARLHGLNHQGA